MAQKLKKIFILIAIFAIAGFFILLISVAQQKQKTEEELLVKPGVTKKEELVNRFGEPLSSKKLSENKEFLEFKSKSPTTNHEAVVDNDKIIFFKQIISYGEPKKVEDIKAVYGETTLTLFGAGSVGGFNLYVYPQKGIAYLGNPNTNDLLELWYFVPTTTEEFIEQHKDEYSTELTPHF